MMNWLQKALGCFHKSVPGKYFGYPEDRRKFYPVSISEDGASTSNYSSRIGIVRPMPTEDQLNKEFTCFVEELDLTPEKQEAMYKLSADKKWRMLCEQSYREERRNGFQAPEHFISILYQVANDPSKANNAVLNHLESLRVTLKTQSHSYVSRFLQVGGVNLMTDILRRCTREKYYGSDQLATALLTCFKALLNSTHGRHSVLSSSKALVSIASATSIESTKGKVTALEILSGLCLVPDGHKKVLTAVTNASKFLGERTRFQKLLFDLWKSFGGKKEEIRLKTAIMSFINALFKTGYAETSLEFRLHLRFEFLMLGIEHIVNEMRKLDNCTLQDHLDLFEMMRQEDEQEFNAQIDSEAAVDFQKPECMYGILKDKLRCSSAYPHFVSALGHLLLIPGDQKNIELWRFFDMVTQQVSLQANIDATADAIEPLPRINLERLLNKLHTERDYEKVALQLKQEQEKSKKLQEKLDETQHFPLSGNSSPERDHL